MLLSLSPGHAFLRVIDFWHQISMPTCSSLRCWIYKLNAVWIKYFKDFEAFRMPRNSIAVIRFSSICKVSVWHIKLGVSLLFPKQNGDGSASTASFSSHGENGSTHLNILSVSVSGIYFTNFFCLRHFYKNSEFASLLECRVH